MTAAIAVVLSAYCLGACCCGKWADGITSSLRYAEHGVSVACGPDLYGKLVWIEGLGVRWCEDTGSAIGRGRIDVLMRSHAEAAQFADGKGRRRARVRVLADWRR